jgi:hypothetical protein
VRFCGLLVALSSRCVRYSSDTVFAISLELGILMQRIPMLDLENGKWRVLAERLAVEMNSEKLTALVDELCLAMDREEQVVASNSFQLQR